MKHFATPKFWKAYESLPKSVQQVADRNYELLKENPFHPSLHFKKVGSYWSVRVGLQYRALGIQDGDSLVWFWIGTHAQYDRLIS
jgi:hypothetical protein